MCHNYAKHFLLVLTLITTASTSFAQRSTRENVPYTRYGIGDLSNPLNVTLRGMGNISSAYSSGLYVNTDNPASYTGLALTTYEVAGEGRVRTLTSGNESFKTGTATLSYLTIGIPVGKNGGLALGLRPNTQAFYLMRDSSYISGLGLSERLYSGEGGTNYAFLGGAWRVKFTKYQSLSVGANAGYLFGTIRQSSGIKPIDTLMVFGSNFDKYYKVGGLYWKGGLLYRNDSLSKNLRLRIGATVTLGQDVNVWKDDISVIYRNISGVGTVTDTASSVKDAKGKVQLPMSYSAGIQLANTSKWMVGIDFNATNWSQYRMFGEQDSVTNMSYRLGLGGEYTPDANAPYNDYFKKVTYRFGFYYGRDYVRLHETDINYMALTAGVTLPFRNTNNPYERSNGSVHLGLEAGRRGTETAGLIKENFVRLSVGLSFSNKWFNKRRYE